MRRVFANIIVGLLVVTTLLLGGCTKPGESRLRRQKFQVISVNKVSGSINKGWSISLTVANNTASNMRITSGSAYLRYEGRKVARIALDGEVLLPRRRCVDVNVPLKLTLSNPLVALSTLNKIRKGDFSNISVDYDVMISALASHRTFERSNVSLEELAKQFNFGLKK